MNHDAADITQLLQRWSAGDQQALDELIPLVYGELHKLAAHYLRAESNAPTLQSTVLVNEAYLRLVKQHSARWQNRTQFYGVAAQIMRRIIVDHARERQAAKRGASAGKVSLDDALTVPVPLDLDLIALDHALNELASFDAHKARIVEMRYFGGMTIEDVAEALSTSATTVKREWAMARAWLYRKLRGGA
jgi:RNA polymerase sigma factor (TIGR02999 family)